MKTLKNKITAKEFEGLCEFVCRRISPEGAVKVDRETMYFAIFWKVCDTIGELISSPDSPESLVGDYRARIDTGVGRFGKDQFDAAIIADRVISKFLASVETDFVAAFILPANSIEADGQRRSDAMRYFRKMSSRFRRFGLSPN